jgi:hypothetical protein
MCDIKIISHHQQEEEEREGKKIKEGVFCFLLFLLFLFFQNNNPNIEFV